MNALTYLAETFGIDPEAKPPVHLPGTRDRTLTQIFADLGFTRGVEVGTERGVYAKQLCRKVPGLRLTCVDPWEAYPDYREHISQWKLDAFFKETKRRLDPYGVEYIRKRSVEAAEDVEDGSLDFVYLDANHEFKFIVEDIYAWRKKVRKDGIVSGHDFRRNSGRFDNDVKDVIGAYTYAKQIRPWFVIDDHESAPSWFWVVA